MVDSFRILTQKIFICSKQAIVSIGCHAFQWYCQNKSGQTEKIIMKQLISFRNIIILRFHYQKNTMLKTLFIFNDNTTPECFHHLLIQAKLFKPARYL